MKTDTVVNIEAKLNVGTTTDCRDKYTDKGIVIPVALKSPLTRMKKDWFKFEAT